MNPTLECAPRDGDALRLRRQIASHARWRVVFALLAFLLPLAPYALFARQARRLEALADHGKTTTASVTGIMRQGSRSFVEYAYTVDGIRYTWSASPEDAPYETGQELRVMVLPEDPSLNVPHVDPARVLHAARDARSTGRYVVLG